MKKVLETRIVSSSSGLELQKSIKEVIEELESNSGELDSNDITFDLKYSTAFDNTATLVNNTLVHSCLIIKGYK